VGDHRQLDGLELLEVDELALLGNLEQIFDNQEMIDRFRRSAPDDPLPVLGDARLALQKHDTRRAARLLRQVVAAATVATGALAAPSVARAQVRRWRMTTSWPRKLPGPGMSAERVAERIRPDLQSQVMKPETAEQLAAMMSRVVEEGTGTAAALSGIQVAGKTGTAEVGSAAQFTQPWFIAFAPVEDPRLAVAVTVEQQPSGSQGGTVAAPIAANVIEAVLGG
jgi:membrane peptidoglycan carboxypeptidase